MAGMLALSVGCTRPAGSAAAAELVMVMYPASVPRFGSTKLPVYVAPAVSTITSPAWAWLRADWKAAEVGAGITAARRAGGRNARSRSAAPSVIPAQVGLCMCRSRVSRDRQIPFYSCCIRVRGRAGRRQRTGARRKTVRGRGIGYCYTALLRCSYPMRACGGFSPASPPGGSWCSAISCWTSFCGKVSRISPEAPVPVVNITRESYYPGGAANVARNLREYTPHTRIVGRVGADRYGCQLLELLAASGIDTSGVLRDASIPTTVKTRVIARNQQVVRVDRERNAPLAPAQVEETATEIARAAAEVDAIVVADYGKGFLNQRLADEICRLARERRVILTVDPHPHTSLSWPGATAIKPNRAEAFLAAGMTATDPVSPPESDGPLLEAGRQLLDRWMCGFLLVTLGEDGMLLLEAGRPPFHIPARTREVFDVSGAGDTAIAVLTMALSAGAAPREAAALANCASGIAVGKLGTATVTIEEMAAALERD